MQELLSFANAGDLMVLIFLEIILGFDNLLYISIESERAPPDQRKMVRRWGISIALIMRLILLFAVLHVIAVLGNPIFSLNYPSIIEGDFTAATLIFLAGGAFLMYTAVREIGHLLSVQNIGHDEQKGAGSKPAWRVITLIVLMNMVFSFDSVLSAIAISDVFIILALAITASVIAMLLLADHVAAFIKRNRQYEVLGLFILLIVGVVLLGEGGHQAHLHLFGYPVEPMAKTTFYFAVCVLVIVDLLQSGYQKKLDKIRAREK